MTAEALKEQLIKELEKLPEDRLREVFDFVGYLLVRGGQGSPPQLSDNLDPQKDPLLQFIGGVSCGFLAKEIDKELYGA